MARDDLELVRYATARLLDRLEGLTDDEYLWEPVPGCWTVREADDGGGWRADLSRRGTTATNRRPAPFTTIAWRLWHLGASPEPTWPAGQATGAEYVAAWFRQIPPTASPAVGTAAEAVDLVAGTWARVADTFAGFDPAEVAAPMGPAAGPLAESTLEALILHVADELIHHGAEVGVVRDLYAHRAG